MEEVMAGRDEMRKKTEGGCGPFNKRIAKRGEKRGETKLRRAERLQRKIQKVASEPGQAHLEIALLR